MTERPVIFNGEMVRAILAGRKTQTRRAITAKMLHFFDVAARVGECHELTSGEPADERSQTYYQQFCPFGQPGDRLWVRETLGDCGVRLVYRADTDDGAACRVKRWTPSIHMPRSAARILLEITDVRVERLNDISEQDALSEGVDDGTSPAAIAAGWFEKPRRAFRRLWERIYGQESWDSNPWVWVVEFKQVQS